jgi:SAM-dependent methyltransferase
MENPTLRCLCEGKHLEKSFEYHTPPAGETRFPHEASDYYRRYDRCKLCSHYFAVNQMSVADFYHGGYSLATYGATLAETFQRIIALPPERSDNHGRVRYIRDFISNHFNRTKPVSLLDVGSGLGVFPYAAKQQGFNVTSIEPDPIAIEHILRVVGVVAIRGNFMNIQNIGLYDVVTFNKVLEHVSDPVGMLIKSKKNLNSDGIIYIEVPDGEVADVQGSGREEFFIEHLHVFSFGSCHMMANAAGLSVLKLERLTEPSGKHTIRAIFSLK